METRLISSLRKKYPVSIILRHAERSPIENMKNALDILLTEQGKKEAYALGQEFSTLSPVMLHYSPVPRCRETAEEIHAGILAAGKEAVLKGDLFNLGGPYIQGDWLQVVKEVDRIGQGGFVRKWFNGEVNRDIIMPLEEAACQQLNTFTANLSENPHSSIYVSHDWNIMILREYFFHISHEDAGFPPFLDGIAAYRENDMLVLNYRDKEVVVKVD